MSKHETQRDEDGPQRSRRALLKAFTAAGLSNLGSIAEVLAQATDAEVRQLTILLQPGLDGICRTYVDPLFVASHRGTGLQYEVSSNGAAYPKMLAQRSNPSISGGMFNDTYSARGVADGMWTKFNADYVPNAKNLIDGLVSPGGLGIPIHFTPFGVMYNPSRVEAPKSWLDLFNPKYKNRVSMWSAYYDGYIMAAVAAGKGPDVEAGIKVWEPHKANIGAWVTSPVVEADLVSRGEVWLAPHWGAWCEQARANGKNVAFTIPSEGAVQWAGHMQSVVGFSPKITEITQRYLDLWLSNPVQLAWVEKGFFSPAVKTIEIPHDLKNNRAILNAEQASKLIRPNYSVIGPNAAKYKDMIDRTLNS